MFVYMRLYITIILSNVGIKFHKRLYIGIILSNVGIKFHTLDTGALF